MTWLSGKSDLRILIFWIFEVHIADTSFSSFGDGICLTIGVEVRQNMSGIGFLDYCPGRDEEHEIVGAFSIFIVRLSGLAVFGSVCFGESIGHERIFVF